MTRSFFTCISKRRSRRSRITLTITLQAIQRSKTESKLGLTSKWSRSWRTWESMRIPSRRQGRFRKREISSLFASMSFGEVSMSLLRNLSSTLIRCSPSWPTHYLNQTCMTCQVTSSWFKSSLVPNSKTERLDKPCSPWEQPLRTLLPMSRWSKM